MSHPLNEIVRAQKNGQALGISAVCSANPWVLAAACQQARQGQAPLLVEATCNQVNQFGGYTGMTPESFASAVRSLAETNGLPPEKLILGGDHLGPSPWQDEPAESAMQKAVAMVRAYVSAGYTKIHLDASMQCADDDAAHPLPPEVSARRAAELCAAAEDAAGSQSPVYVIGTEVPPPGGARAGHAGPAASDPEEARQTIDLFQRTFQQSGLAGAWERVIALVVQPGVEFGNTEIQAYERDKAGGLARMIESVPGLVYEAHSTDYQTPQHLKQMVEDHFAILKVGPALTFALREAVFALARIEQEWLAGKESTQSNLVETVEKVMLAEPKYWKKYYPGTAAEQAFARKYSLSDRVRYYWPHPELQAALQRLVDNLSLSPAPASLLSQYMPVQYARVRAGELDNTPGALILDHIQDVLLDYASACGSWQTSPRF